MKLGFYSAILHDHPLIEALATVKKLGLSGYEINTGGFLPPVHVPIDNLLQNPESNTPPKHSTRLPALQALTSPKGKTS